MTWPLNWRVFHARLRALLCRSQHLRCCADPEGTFLLEEQPIHACLVVGDIRIDLSGCKAWLNEEPVALSTRLFNLLLYFVQHQGIVISRRELFDGMRASTQGSSGLPEEYADDRLLDVYVHWLWEEIEEDVAHPQHIQTVRGIGYRFMR